MVKERYSNRSEIDDRIMKEAASRFGVAPDCLMGLHESVKIFRGDRFVEKSLYLYECHGKEFILKLTHPRYVDFGLIEGEVDWINYLADHRLHVPRAVTSENGSLVEIIESEGSRFAAVSFEKMEGREFRFDDPGEWNTDLFEKYGRTIGRIHALTKRYFPKNKELRRIKWFEQDWVSNIEEYVPASESLFLQKHSDLLETLRSLPKNKDSFGLIHGDAHPWNALIHEGNIILTDFDFCEHSWFASEIAIILFYAVMAPTQGMDKNAFANLFLESFITGYREENDMDAYWLKQIPLFLRLRMLSKCILHYPEWQSNTMTEKRKSAFMKWKHKIENDIPYLNLDFSELT